MMENNEETGNHVKVIEGEKAGKRFDKGALNGLRGFFAFHIMAYHACLFFKHPTTSKPTIDLYANVDIPLFFLLSGFSLTIAYGKTFWNGSTRGCFGLKTTTNDGVDKTETQNGELKIFDSWEFYKKRIIRIMPLHYFGHIAVITLNLFGVWPEDKWEMMVGFFLSLFALNTWILPHENFGPNGVSWTICTLFSWYWVFPTILPRLQRLNDRQIARGIVKCFWLQIGFAFLIIMSFGGFVGSKFGIYWMSTAHPMIRFPVFLMGMLGGLQVLRAYNNKDSFEDPNLCKNLLHTLLPWGSQCKRRVCCLKKDLNGAVKKISTEERTIIWRRRVDFNALLYIGFLLGLTVTKAVLDVHYPQHGTYWIGGNDMQEEGSFTWLNGTTDEFGGYTNWGNKEPNNNNNNEDCIQMYYEYDGKWNDASCKNKLPFMCQRLFCNANQTNWPCLEETSYNIMMDKKSWNNANEVCMKNNGTLAIINSEDINKFILKLAKNSIKTLDEFTKKIFQSSDFFGLNLQFLAVHSQLTIIIGLCLDSGTSLASKFLRTKIMQFFGRISLSLYLLHWPLMGYIILSMKGKQDEEPSWDELYGILPNWAPIILIVLSPIVSFIVTKYFEEPIASFLKGDKINSI